MAFVWILIAISSHLKPEKHWHGVRLGSVIKYWEYEWEGDISNNITDLWANSSSRRCPWRWYYYQNQTICKVPSSPTHSMFYDLDQLKAVMKLLPAFICAHFRRNTFKELRHVGFEGVNLVWSNTEGNGEITEKLKLSQNIISQNRKIYFKDKEKA